MPADIAGRCRQGRPLAVLEIGGTADPIMPFQGGAVSTMGGAGEGGQVLSLADTADSGPGAMDADFRTGPGPCPRSRRSTGPVSCT
jgi:hypothetical protein